MFDITDGRDPLAENREIAGIDAAVAALQQGGELSLGSVSAAADAAAGAVGNARPPGGRARPGEQPLGRTAVTDRLEPSYLGRQVEVPRVILETLGLGEAESGGGGGGRGAGKGEGADT